MKKYFDKGGHVHIIADLWSDRKRVSYGNGKTGIYSVNLLAGDRESVYSGSIPEPIKDYMREQNICGSCSGDCPGCYAKDMTRYPEVIDQMIMNTIEARLDPVRFWALVEKELESLPEGFPDVMRIHDSGDFVTYDYMVACFEFIKRHPGTRFGAYSKEKEMIEKYGLDKVYAISNMTLQCSPWPGHCEPIGVLPQFWYDDHTNPDLEKLPHCPAVAKDGTRTGVQCKNCMHCYTAGCGEAWAVYKHGKTRKAKK